MLFHLLNVNQYKIHSQLSTIKLTEKHIVQIQWNISGDFERLTF